MVSVTAGPFYRCVQTALQPQIFTPRRDGDPAAFRSRKEAETESVVMGTAAATAVLHSLSVQRRRTRRKAACWLMVGPNSLRPLSSFRIGEKIRGTVKWIDRNAPGALVDIGAKRLGFLHISNMSRDFVENMDDYVQRGQEVDVWVQNVKGDERISLALFDTRLPDPCWLTVGSESLRALSTFEVGERVRGVVKWVDKKNNFALVDIAANRLGFLDISNTSKIDSAVENVGDSFFKGLQLDMWVAHIAGDERISLALFDTSQLRPVGSYRVGDKVKGRVKWIDQKIYAAFVDIGATRLGLLPQRLMAKEFVERMEDYVQRNLEVDVWIDQLDGERMQLALFDTSQLRPLSSFKLGEKIKGVVCSVNEGQALINVQAAKVALLIFNKQRSSRNRAKVLKPGQSVTAWVAKESDGEDGRLEVALDDVNKEIDAWRSRLEGLTSDV
eukprot:TRINITY_DN49943_c0_g1_i1.p1 TRINITY_DN49943_c0_g1~~TRINITY_DN49943_c0_g1_i1.p1  ORF type:complete len:443 (+),score=89.40 TRINITY_DN49943_c0_g1_i1:33-1361(+)